MLNGYNLLKSNKISCSGLNWNWSSVDRPITSGLMDNVHFSVISNCIKFRIIGLHQIPYYRSESNSDSSMLVNVMCCCTKYHQQAPHARQCKQGLNITGDWVDQKLFPNLKGVESLKKSEVKLMLNNLLNWSVSWNGWMNCILNLYFQFLIIFFCLFGQILGTFWHFSD